LGKEKHFLSKSRGIKRGKRGRAAILKISSVSGRKSGKGRSARGMKEKKDFKLGGIEEMLKRKPTKMAENHPSKRGPRWEAGITTYLGWNGTSWRRCGRSSLRRKLDYRKKMRGPAFWGGGPLRQRSGGKGCTR